MRLTIAAAVLLAAAAPLRAVDTTDTRLVSDPATNGGTVTAPSLAIWTEDGFVVVPVKARAGARSRLGGPGSWGRA